MDTREARGSQKTLDRLARKFGLLLADGRFVPPEQKHVLFFGHTGSGKTTELRHYAEELSGRGKFFIVEVDITVTLDRNNLQYADTLMAMAQSLLQRLFDKGVTLPASALEDLKNWFDERVLSAEDSKEFSAEIRSGAKAELGLPFLIKLFTAFTTHSGRTRPTKSRFAVSSVTTSRSLRRHSMPCCASRNGNWQNMTWAIASCSSSTA